MNNSYEKESIETDRQEAFETVEMLIRLLIAKGQPEIIKKTATYAIKQIIMSKCRTIDNEQADILVPIVVNKLVDLCQSEDTRDIALSNIRKIIMGKTYFDKDNIWKERETTVFM